MLNEIYSENKNDIIHIVDERGRKQRRKEDLLELGDLMVFGGEQVTELRQLHLARLTAL